MEATRPAFLGIGNPFYDELLPATQDLLTTHGLQIGITQSTAQWSEIDTIWQAVLKQNATPQKSTGGSSLNTIKNLQYLGNSCAFCGKRGPYDQEIETRLRNIGITSLLRKGTLPTGVVKCYITKKENQDNDQRTMQTYYGASMELSEADLNENDFRDIEVVHIEGYVAYFKDVLKTSLDFAKKQGAKTSLSLGSPGVVKRDLYDACAAKIDCLFGNFQEMETLTGQSNMKEALEDFDLNQTIVATDGKNGCLVKFKGDSDPVHYDALSVTNVVDTIGAGDAFAAGFWYGLRQERSADDCVQMGNIAASFTIQQWGTDLSASKQKEMKELILKV